MPTYEYRCPKGHEFDRFYKTISAAPAEERCPECGAVAERKISGGAGFAFKGSGFYLTDYGKNAHRKPGPDTKSESTKSDTPKSETQSESASKPETPKPKTESAKPKPKAE